MQINVRYILCDVFGEYCITCLRDRKCIFVECEKILLTHLVLLLNIAIYFGSNEKYFISLSDVFTKGVQS